MSGSISGWMRHRRIHTIADWRLRELIARTGKVDPRQAESAIDALVDGGALVRVPARAPRGTVPNDAWNYRLASAVHEAEASPTSSPPAG